MQNRITRKWFCADSIRPRGSTGAGRQQLEARELRLIIVLIGRNYVGIFVPLFRHG